MLAPVNRISDVDAALAYAQARSCGSEVHLAFLHVSSAAEAQSGAAAPGHAEVLLEHAESRSRAAAVAHDSYILAGDLVFSILDAAELLACDAIVMSRPKPRPWHRLFQPTIVRRIEELSRDVPLILIDADGVVIRSKHE